MKRKNHGTRGKRRANGTGTLRLKGEVYQMVFTVYDKSLGKTRQISKTTGTTDRKEAEKILEHTFYEYGFKGASDLDEQEIFLNRLKEKSNSIHYQREKEAQKLLKEAEKRAVEERERNAISVDDAFKAFEESQSRKRCSQRTLYGYKGQYAIFAQWIHDHHPEVQKLYAITRPIAEEFLTYQEKRRSGNTRDKYLKLMSYMWKVLKWTPNALLAVDPWEGFAKLATAGNVVHHHDMEPEDLKRFFRTMMREGLKDLFVFDPSGRKGDKMPKMDLRAELFRACCLMMHTGCRLADACRSFHWEEVNLEDEEITYAPIKTLRRYGWKVTMPLHRNLKAELMSVPECNRKGPVCPMLAKIHAEHEPSCITNRIQAIFEAAGFKTTIPAPDDDNGQRRRVVIGSYSMRHFFISILSNGNCNQELVNYLAQHKQTTVEAGYYHKNAVALRKAIDLIPFMPDIFPFIAHFEPIDKGNKNDKLSD